MSQINTTKKNIVSAEDPGPPSLEIEYLSSLLAPGDTVLWAGRIDETSARVILRSIQSTGILVCSNRHKNELSQIQRLLKNPSNLILVDGPIHRSSLRKGSFDLIVSNSVLEYAGEADVCLQTYEELLKEGGRLLVAERDNHLLCHYPLAPHAEEQLQQIARELSSQGIWDPFVGRKLYSLAQELRLKDIRMACSPYEIITSNGNSSDLDEWETWFSELKHWKSSGQWKSSVDLDEFRQEFLKFFENPERFSYSPCILLEAIRSN